ncbi:unnamed protein product [Effrenium voratum]|uniref:Uncharacterized protein n=1 Tax=Effrenium voratum TaxID=2562239 RepID=A0AA36N1L7_9DINO|nr:unnamed protein product [Effrenium voratum]
MASSDSGGEDWMELCQEPAAKPAVKERAAPPAKLATVPVNKGQPTMPRKEASSAWKAWMQPRPGSSELGHTETPPPKARKDKQAWEKHMAAAAQAAKKAAEAAEASVRLAHMAAQQMAQTMANRVAAGSRTSRAPNKAEQPTPPKHSPPAALPTESPQQANPLKRALSFQAETPEQASPEEPQQEPTKEASAGSAPGKGKKDRAARFTAGTFAGNRPPAKADLRETFDLKKKVFEECRDELVKKYPGKCGILGKTKAQTAYWTFLQSHIGKTKAKSKTKMSQAEARDCVREASQLWKAQMEKSLCKKK